MTWWTEQGLDPKRKNRFKVLINNIFVGYATSVGKPKVTIDSKEYKMINHFYKYPGIAKWEDITISFVDMYSKDASHDTSEFLFNILKKSGYDNPGKSSSGAVGKNLSSQAVGDIIIQQLNGDGDEIETWTLKQCIISSLEWGDLSYSEDGLVEYKMGIKYDYAQFSKPKQTQQGG